MDEARKRKRFEALARPELNALFRTAWRIVGRRAVAEEIVQEACFRAYASFDVANEPATFRPWLFRIAVNLALDALRRGQHETHVTHEDATEAQLVADEALAGQPHAVVEGRDIGRALERALAMLSPELRAVAILVLVEEMSYGEAAATLGVTEDLVRSRLSRARGDLRRQLAVHGADLSARPRDDGSAQSVHAPSIKRGPQ